MKRKECGEAMKGVEGKEREEVLPISGREKRKAKENKKETLVQQLEAFNVHHNFILKLLIEGKSTYESCLFACVWVDIPLLFPSPICSLLSLFFSFLSQK